MEAQSKSSNIVITVILLVVGFVGVGAGVYFWSENQSLQEQQQAQTMRVDTEEGTQGASEQELSLNQGQPGAEAEAPGTITLSQEVITGQAVRPGPGESIVIECFVLPGRLTTLWVQYGNTLIPQEQTNGITEGLDEGEEGMYMPIAVPIPDGAIENNALYSYQCLGANSQDEIRSAGIASFNVQ